MASPDPSELHDALNVSVKARRKKDAIGIVSKLNNEEFTRLWHHSVITNRNVDIMWFLWRCMNYRFQTPDSLTLKAQIGDSILDLPNCLGGFRFIDLSDCHHLTDSSILGLHYMRKLVRVSLKNCQLISANAITNWIFENGEPEPLPSLLSLDLSGTSFSDTGILPLVGGFRNLSILALDRTKVTNNSIAALSQMPKLQVLSVSGCKGITKLCTSILLKYPRLVSIDLSMTSFSDTEQDELLSQFKKLKHLKDATVNDEKVIQLEHTIAGHNLVENLKEDVFLDRAISHEDLLSGLIACESSARSYTRQSTRDTPLTTWLTNLPFTTSCAPEPASNTSKRRAKSSASRSKSSNTKSQVEQSDDPDNPLCDLISAASKASTRKGASSSAKKQGSETPQTLKQSVSKARQLSKSIAATAAADMSSLEKRAPASENANSEGFVLLKDAADQLAQKVPNARPSRGASVSATAKKTATTTLDSSSPENSEQEVVEVEKLKGRKSAPVSPSAASKSLKSNPVRRKSLESNVISATPTNGIEIFETTSRASRSSFASQKSGTSPKTSIVPSTSIMLDETEATQRTKQRRGSPDLDEDLQTLIPTNKKTFVDVFEGQEETLDEADSEASETETPSELPPRRRPPLVRTILTRDQLKAKKKPRAPPEIKKPVVRESPDYPGVSIPLPGQCSLGPPQVVKRFEMDESNKSNFKLSLSRSAQKAYNIQSSLAALDAKSSNTKPSARALSFGGFIVAMTNKKDTSAPKPLISLPEPTTMDLDATPIEKPAATETTKLEPVDNSLRIVSYLPPTSIHSEGLYGGYRLNPHLTPNKKGPHSEEQEASTSMDIDASQSPSQPETTTALQQIRPRLTKNRPPPTNYFVFKVEKPAEADSPCGT